MIADVAGHGPESAAFMVQVRNILRAVAVEHRRADEVLRRVNDVLNRLREAEGLFVTCCYATLDSTRGVLTFASAGHPPPLVVSAGSSTYPAVAPGPPLAAVPLACHPLTSIPVLPRDRIFLFTDELVERRDESLDVGMERLAESAAALHDVDVQDAVERLGAQVTAQFDDLAILCAEIENAAATR